MPLKGVKVIEFASEAVTSFCGMILADYGASVIRIDRIGQTCLLDCLGNGKLSIAVNIKDTEGAIIIKKLCQKADVLIESFRDEVMESCGLGPEVLLKVNPQLIYARINGYGRNGIYSNKGGHDLNYLAMSGLLSLFGRYDGKPAFPINFSALAGGSLTCALGIIMALFERKSSGLGQIVDTSMISGTAYIGSWLFRTQNINLGGNEKENSVYGGRCPFYNIYETKDGKFVSVAACEPHFYLDLLKGLNLNYEGVQQFDDFEKNLKIFEQKFKEKTVDEWMIIFDKLDACVTPVLDIDSAPKNPHNIQQNTFLLNNKDCVVPKPAPILSRTAGLSNSHKPIAQRGEHTKLLLIGLNYSQEEILTLERNYVIECHENSKL